MEAGYAVVQFTEWRNGDTCDAVPVAWLQTIGSRLMCYYPKTGIKTAIKNCASPRGDWDLHSVKRLSHKEIQSYDLALKKRRQAFDTSGIDSSDVERDDIPPSPKKRFVQAPRRFDDSEYEQSHKGTNLHFYQRNSRPDKLKHLASEHLAPILPPPASTLNKITLGAKQLKSPAVACGSSSAKSHHMHHMPVVVDEGQHRHSPDDADLTLPAQEDDVALCHQTEAIYSDLADEQLTEFATAAPSLGQEPDTYTNTNQYNQHSESVAMNKTPLSSLHCLCPGPSVSSIPFIGLQSTPTIAGSGAPPRATTIEEKLDNIMKALGSMADVQNRILQALESSQRPTKDAVDFELEATSLPISTEEAMEYLSQVLLDRNRRRQLRSFLAKIGGRDLAANCHNVMKACITYSLASNYSLLGARSKKCFNQLPVYKVIVQSILLSQPSAKHSSIDEHLSSFLKHAPEKPGCSRYKRRKTSMNRTLTPLFNGSDSDE